MAHKQKPILELEKFAPYLLSFLSNRISTGIASTYRNKFALTVTEWRIMAVLGEYPGSSGEEVSYKTMIEKSILSRAIQKLLKRKLIERSIDESDRRRQVLVLSSIGKDIYNQIVPLTLAYEKRVLECFSEKEKSDFSNLIGLLLKHVENLEDE